MPDLTIPKPTSSHVLYGGAVEIHCFGRPQNWSLAGRTQGEADWNNPGIRYRMFRLAELYGIGRIYAPNPSRFNALIAHPDAFDVDWAGGRIYRGPFADGVLLTEPNTAFAVSGADCPTVVIHDPIKGTVTAAHAGFRSLHTLNLENPQDFSVRDSVTLTSVRETLLASGTESTTRFVAESRLKAFICCGISGEAYKHPIDHSTRQLQNERIVGWLCRHFRETLFLTDHEWSVDLPLLIQLQLSQLCDLAPKNIGLDGVCTHSDTCSDGQALWHSNRRDGAKAGRNLVLVIRR